MFSPIVVNIILLRNSPSTTGYTAVSERYLSFFGRVSSQCCKQLNLKVRILILQSCKNDSNYDLCLNYLTTSLFVHCSVQLSSWGFLPDQNF